MVDDSKLDYKKREEYREIIKNYIQKGSELYTTIKDKIEDLEKKKSITFQEKNMIHYIADFLGMTIVKDKTYSKNFPELIFEIPLEGRLKIKQLKVSSLGTFHEKIVYPFHNDWVKTESEDGVSYRMLEKIAENESYINDNSQVKPTSARGNPDKALETLRMIKNMLDRPQFWEHCGRATWE